MLTRPNHPIAATSWHAVSRRGPRRINADATAVCHDPVAGRSAFVVADGVGDSDAAAAAAALAAGVAAETAPALGPVAAVLAAQEAVLAADGDCVLVVAVPGEYSCDVAWVGDCRAYHSNGRVLEQITVDHTLAEHLRGRAQVVPPRAEHVVMTSVRTVRPDRVGSTRTGLVTGRLLLCSDGVHRYLSAHDIGGVLDQPFGPEVAARLLADRALDNGGRDNCTALVVDHVPPRGPALAA